MRSTSSSPSSCGGPKGAACQKLSSKLRANKMVVGNDRFPAEWWCLPIFWATAVRPGGLGRDWDLADVLRDLVALLGRRPLGDRQIPAFDVGVLVHVDGLPLEPRDPRPDRDV